MSFREDATPVRAYFDKDMILSWPPSIFNVTAVLIVYILYVVTRGIYRAYFDGLSRYPGPKLWAMSELPIANCQLRGEMSHKAVELHEKYGPVVRTSPRALSYIKSAAWADIYAKTRPQLMKDPTAGPPPPNGIKGLAFTDSDLDHSRMRRNLSHGFSEKALREQEGIMMKYVDLMMKKLHEQCSKPMDMSGWFNFVTVDIIGDLTFGESFYCLENSKLHDWVANIFTFLKTFVIVGVLTRIFPVLGIAMFFAKKTKGFQEIEAKHRGFINQSLAKRLDRKDPRPDFMTYVQRHTGTPTGMSIEELQETCNALILGGSETTASVLSGTIFQLLRSPEKLVRLTEEIRSMFKTEAEITIVSTNRLIYQSAVLEEGLRMFPPLPQQILRVTTPEGNIIAGEFVPGGTTVGFAHIAAYMSPKYFKDPREFVPERWLEPSNPFYDQKYANDQKEVLKPFSFGPRNCIGINLAYAELRLILAKLLWNFDLEYAKNGKDWLTGMKVYAVYQRGPLMIKLVPVARD